MIPLTLEQAFSSHQAGMSMMIFVTRKREWIEDSVPTKKGEGGEEGESSLNDGRAG